MIRLFRWDFARWRGEAVLANQVGLALTWHFAEGFPFQATLLLPGLSLFVAFGRKRVRETSSGSTE